MANIRTITYWDDGEKKAGATVRSDGVFRVKLPAHVATALGCSAELSGDNLDALEIFFKKTICYYHDIKTIERKVILATFSANVCVFDKKHTGNHHDDKCLLRKKDMHFAKGAVLSINATVATEIKQHQGGDDYHFRYESFYGDFASNPMPSSFGCRSLCDSCDGPNDKNVRVFNWTQTREDFFRAMGEGIEGTIMKLDEAFSNPERLLTLIDSGERLLPESSSDM